MKPVRVRKLTELKVWYSKLLWRITEFYASGSKNSGNDVFFLHLNSSTLSGA